MIKNKHTCTFYKTGTLNEKYKHSYSVWIQKELSFIQCDKQQWTCHNEQNMGGMW